MIRQFLFRWHSPIRALACAITVFTCCLWLTACGVPVWLSDATSLMPLLSSTAASILAIIAAFGGAVSPSVATGISTWATNIENGLNDIENLVKQYNADPTETLLQKIQQVSAMVTQNCQQILTDSGMPSALAAKVGAIAQLISTQLASWLTLLPALHPTAGTAVTITVPMTKMEFNEAFNAILDTPTGDATVDEALKKLKR